MRVLSPLLALAACAPSPTGSPPDLGAVPIATDTADDRPRCPGPGAPCDALPVRADPPACGPAFFAPDDHAFAGPMRWPATLTATACFTSVDPLVPHPTTAPYTVRAPLWSEGADKGRWWSVPSGRTVGFAASGPWDFPDGSVLLKAFGYAPDDAHPDRTRLLEVRVMVRAEGAWHFATYPIDPSGQDGALLADTGRFADLEVVRDGRPDTLTWWFPGTEGCLTCHRPQATQALGTATVQLHVEVDYGHVVADQLVALAAAGWLDGLPERLDALPSMASPYDASAAPDARARAWLHGQCAHCHTPGGFQPPDLHLDLRHDTPLADTHTCDVPQSTGPRWDRDALITPGDPDGSHLLWRLTAPSGSRMPPGTTHGDPDGIAVVEAWIASLEACP